jgi:hypothetical protein
LAFAFTPSEIQANDCYQFMLYHQWVDVSPSDVFGIEMQSWNFEEAMA